MKDFKVEVALEESRIVMLLIGAWEGGSDYWCEADGQPYRLKDEKLHLPVACRDKEGDLAEGFPHLLTRKGIQKGLNILAEKYPWHFAAILSGDDDAETSDAFFQCALLGDIIYG